MCPKDLYSSPLGVCAKIGLGLIRSFYFMFCNLITENESNQLTREQENQRMNESVLHFFDQPTLFHQKVYEYFILHLRITTLFMSASLITRGLPAVTKAPLNPYAPVAKWILGTSGMVAGMVHIGGVTRLTKSGLSMTDWKPLGSLPPMNTQDWMKEFDRYKEFPEWQQRKSMTLDEFQYIYFWEWGHRMLGRVVGICFAAPWAYFAFRKKIPSGYNARMRLLFVMGGTQGLVGWWMVRSGLTEDRRNDKKEIRVSPYRLAAHLGMAFTTYATLLYTGLGILQIPNDAVPKAANGASSKILQLTHSLSHDAIKYAKRIRFGAIGVTTLTAITVASGAFVAGNDAGNAYNTFPKMDDQWIPMDDMIDPELKPTYRNAFENTALVQWNHRVLGTSTALGSLALASFGLFHPASRQALTPQVNKGLKVLAGVAIGQMSLGIATLLNYVPITLAATHQLGSLVVLSTGIYVCHSLRYVSPSVLRNVTQKVASSAASGGRRTISGSAMTGKHSMVQ
jgi:heme a synthase